MVYLKTEIDFFFVNNFFIIFFFFCLSLFLSYLHHLIFINPILECNFNFDHGEFRTK